MVPSVHPDGCPSLSCCEAFTFALTLFYLTLFLKLELCGIILPMQQASHSTSFLSFVVVYKLRVIIYKHICHPAFFCVTNTSYCGCTWENGKWAFSKLANEIIFLFPSIRYKILLLKPDAPKECSVIPRMPLKTCLFSLTRAICLDP